VNEFDEEPDKTHYAKTNSRGDCDFLEFFPVGFGASFHQPDRVFGELPSGFQHFGDLIHILSRRSGQR